MLAHWFILLFGAPPTQGPHQAVLLVSRVAVAVQLPGAVAARLALGSAVAREVTLQSSLHLEGPA